MRRSSWLLDGDHLHAELGSALLEVLQYPLAIALLVVILSLVGVLLAFGEHRIDEPRELVRRGLDGLGLVHARAQPPVVRAERGLARA